MSLCSQEDFLKKLESELFFQSQLEKKQLLPKKLGWIGRLVVVYFWQVLVVTSIVSALVVHFL